MGGVAEDIRLSVIPIEGVAEWNLLPSRIPEYAWMDPSVLKHTSQFETTASLKSFTSSIYMLDLE